MTKWEYKSACIPAIESVVAAEFDEVLNEFGAARWELVAYDFDTGVGIFKRPVAVSTFDVLGKFYAAGQGDEECPCGCGYIKDDLLADADAEEAIR